LWWACNISLLKEKFIPPEITRGVMLNLVEELTKEPKEKNLCNLELPSIDFEVPLGNFDGACQGHPPMCKVGVILYINHNHYMFIRYALSVGTNNIVEFIALWTLLETTIKKDIKKIQVMGDSKLVIDWARQKNSTQDFRLAPIMRDIKHDY
jgi:hypothetical protein